MHNVAKAGEIPTMRTLANGVTCLFDRDARFESAALGVFVVTGARDEEPGESGISHFLEHMVFKGTRSFSGLELSAEFGRVGATANAYTSEESTVYYAHVLPTAAPRMAELLAELLHPRILPDDFETERKVILEEIALYQDRPSYYLMEEALRQYFQDHPVGASVLGSSASIRALSAEQMRSYLQRRYTGSQLLVVVSGNFDHTEVDKQLCRQLSGLPHGTPMRDCPPYLFSPRSGVLHRAGSQQAHLLMLCPAPAAEDPRRYDAALWCALCNDISERSLYWRLMHTGLAESVSIESTEHQGVGVYSIYASCDPDTLPQVEEEIERALASPMDFTDAELARAQRRSVTRLAYGSELPLGRMMALGNEWLQHRAIFSREREIERILAVSKTSISELHLHFPVSARSVFRLLPSAAPASAEAL